MRTRVKFVLCKTPEKLCLGRFSMLFFHSFYCTINSSLNLLWKSFPFYLRCHRKNCFPFRLVHGVVLLTKTPPTSTSILPGGKMNESRIFGWISLISFQSGVYNRFFFGEIFPSTAEKTWNLCYASVDIILGILLSLCLGIPSVVNQEWEAFPFIFKLLPLHLRQKSCFYSRENANPRHR